MALDMLPDGEPDMRAIILLGVPIARAVPVWKDMASSMKSAFRFIMDGIGLHGTNATSRLISSSPVGLHHEFIDRMDIVSLL